MAHKAVTKVTVF